MPELLTRSVLSGLGDHETKNGYLLIQDWEVVPTKGGGRYIKGVAQGKGAVPFKCWSDSQAYLTLADRLEKDRCPFVCLADITCSIYNEKQGFVIDKIQMSDGGHTNMDFLEDVYNADACWANLVSVLSSHVSESAMQVFYLILSDGRVKDRFLYEFAAVRFHDSCKSGLLAHTYKTVSLLSATAVLYTELLPALDTDALFVGAALHDIGKCLEYQDGQMSEAGMCASHPVLGSMLVSEYREKICELTNIGFYHELIGIISGHHGIYGERPRRIPAYLVHLFDKLESDLASLEGHVHQDNAVGISSVFTARDGYKVRY